MVEITRGFADHGTPATRLEIPGSVNRRQLYAGILATAFVAMSASGATSGWRGLA